MKSYANYFQGLYTAILVDVAESIPSLQSDCERDVSRLLSLVDSRGLSFLTIDLPQAAKHFESCLAAGHLTPFKTAGFRPYKRGTSIPRLFKGLMVRVFDFNGVLIDGSNVAEIRFLRQLFLAAKKVKILCNQSRTWEHVHEFFDTDQEVRSPTLNWDDDELRIEDLPHCHFGDDDFVSDPAPLLDFCHSGDDPSEESHALASDFADVVQRTADIVVACLGGFDPSDWRVKHGPGAVSDLKGGEFKYSFPNWPDKLQHVFPADLFAFANASDWAAYASGVGDPVGLRPHEPPSKMVAVQKTQKGPRLIAAEPTAHQWCQQSIKDFLTTRLAKTPIAGAIAFRDQTHNQDLAKLASHCQSHATVDLSSASDRLSCWVVERLFRRNKSLVLALHASRTRWVYNPIDRRSPKYSRIRKFACMGSACTFPVQTYAFAVMAIASVLFERRLQPSIKQIRRVSKEVQVFGDDIIIPSDSVDRLLGLLRHLGLKVNHSKTFVTGKFRESCGLDAYDGHDVTPTYSMTYPDVSRPESIISCVATHNNFILRGYYRTAHYVQSTVLGVRNFSFPSVPIGSGAFGWFDPFGVGNSHLKKRWNPSLQRIDYRLDVISVTSDRVLPKSHSPLLQYFTEVRPVPFIRGDRLGVAGRASISIRRRWEGHLDANPSGSRLY